MNLLRNCPISTISLLIVVFAEPPLPFIFERAEMALICMELHRLPWRKVPHGLRISPD
jgi:hypothetical protein